MKIFDSQKGKLDAMVDQLKSHARQPLSDERMATITSFWLNASSDLKVCARLQEEGLPVTLYTFIREENPKDAGRILKNLDEDLLKELIKLMLKVSAGHEKSE